MRMQAREQKSAEVYIKLLKRKGFSPESLTQRTEFLNSLLPLLNNVGQSDRTYRNFVEKLMGSLPEANWPERLLIAREYYPFWSGNQEAEKLSLNSNIASML